MADTTEILEIARKLERIADADDILGDPVPVRRKVLSEGVRVLRKAYTELQTTPTADEASTQEIAGLRHLCRWFAAALGLDDDELSRTLPAELLLSARWLWAEEEPEEVSLPELPPTPELRLEETA
jgi:hypothetical protein